MKCLLLLVFITVTFASTSQNPYLDKPMPTPPPVEDVHFDVREMPVFPGGPDTMQKYLEKHIIQPSIKRGACVGHRLVVGFIVEKDGSLSDITIVKSINGCPDFDFDVVRVVREMPKWIPGRRDGKVVRCFYKMPVYIG